MIIYYLINAGFEKVIETESVSNYRINPNDKNKTYLAETLFSNGDMETSIKQVSRRKSLS